MALDNINEDVERKRKETEFQANQNSNTLPGISNPVVSPGKLAPRKNILKELPNQASPGQVTNMAPGRLAELTSMNAKLQTPTINEVPDARRDSELGKMTSSNQGNTSTYDINGDSLEYTLSGHDGQLKTNLEKINQMIDSGVKVSPEQMSRITSLRQQAGFLRGGTDRRPVGPDGLPLQQGSGLRKIGNMDVQFSPETSQEEINRFNEIPVQANQPTWNDLAVQDNNRRLASLGQGNRSAQNADRNLGLAKDIRVEGELFTKENSPNMGWKTREALNQQLLANKQSSENTLAQIGSQQNIARNSNALTAETNRINEISNSSQNKFRDIQGQVALKPPVKENDSYDKIDIYNDLGQVTGQQLYNKRTGEKINQAATFTTPKPATTEKLLKMRTSKDPNFAAAEAEYKMRFGSLPY
jgi:hypothetical protein